MRRWTKYSRVERITYEFEEWDIKQALLDAIAKGAMGPQAKDWQAHTEVEFDDGDEDHPRRARIIWHNENDVDAPDPRPTPPGSAENTNVSFEEPETPGEER